MQPQEQIDVPAKGQVKLEPGALHVMLVGLKKDLKAGDTFTMVLTFAKAGDRDITVTVREP